MREKPNISPEKVNIVVSEEKSMSGSKHCCSVVKEVERPLCIVPFPYLADGRTLQVPLWDHVAAQNVVGAFESV